MALEIANEVVSKCRHSKLPKSKAKLLEDNENVTTKDYVREKTKEKEAISGDFGRDQNRKMAKLADKSSSLDFEINELKRQLIITYSNIKS